MRIKEGNFAPLLYKPKKTKTGMTAISAQTTTRRKLDEYGYDPMASHLRILLIASEVSKIDTSLRCGLIKYIRECIRCNAAHEHAMVQWLSISVSELLTIVTILGNRIKAT